MEKLTGRTQKFELIDGRDVEIINVPHLNIVKNLKKKHEIFEEFGINKDEVYNSYIEPGTVVKYFKTWNEFLDEAIMVQQSFMRHGTPKLNDPDEYNLGTTVFASLRDYLNEVGEEHDRYYAEVLEFRVKCTPPRDELSDAQAISLINAFLSQKKSIDHILDSLNYKTLRNFIITLAKEHEKLHQKNLQNITSSTKPSRSKKI